MNRHGAGRSLSEIHMRMELITFMIVILGVPGYFYQQYQSSQEKKIAQTMEFIYKFQEERLSRVRESLLKPWIKYEKEINYLNSTDGIDGKAFRAWVNKIILASKDKEGDDNVLNNVFLIVDYFDQLHLCVVSKLCDSETAKRYYRDYLIGLNCLYGEKIIELRKKILVSSFGEGFFYFLNDKSKKKC